MNYERCYYQIIYIDLTNVNWNKDDNGYTFDDTFLDQYCNRIPMHRREEFKKIVYERILIIKASRRNIYNKTEMILSEFGTLVSIEGF